MQKTITKTIILLAILTLALGVNYLFAAWTGPTQAPPEGNTPTPIHVGSTNQVKDGGLSLDALSVFGGGYFQGNVGIGVVTPTEALDVSGGVKIGNTTNENAGTIRFTGTDFEGYDGTQWVSLISGEVVADPNYIDCINAGGNWIDAQGVCYFSGASCPSGWQQKELHSSTSSNYCSFDGGVCGSDSCTTGSHNRINAGVETCTYKKKEWGVGTAFQGGRSGGCRNTPIILTCTATKTEIGCTKN